MSGVELVCDGGASCGCGCCGGIAVMTPAQTVNAPGLPAIGFRTGTWSSFRETMLARLSSAAYPALAPLQTRDDGDFTVAFLDATATMLDILTFYQERLANESFLRTAQQLRSLTELSRLIGYQPAPAVAASAYLAFTLKAAPGYAADPTTPAITIPAGTQAQSVPAQGQTPQTFETAAPILAKPDWNALAVLTGAPWVPQTGDVGVYLAGTTTQLNPGDLILIVGDERAGPQKGQEWDVRLLTAVTPDILNARTYVQWGEGLGGGGVTPAELHPKFYALRQRAALFGYNAIDPRMLDTKNTSISSLLSGTEWSGFYLSGSIDLDAVYPKITQNSWVVMIAKDANISRSPAGYVDLFNVSQLTQSARTQFGITAKITRIYPDITPNSYYFPLRETAVFAQSEWLAAAEQPFGYPLYGSWLDLETLRPDLAGITAVALFGKAQKLAVTAAAGPLSFQPDDDSTPATLNPGDIVTLLSPAPLPINPDGSVPAWTTAAVSGTQVNFLVRDASGRSGTLPATPGSFTLVPAVATDPDIEEFALVAALATSTKPFPHTLIQLQNSLLNAYDRTKTSVNANTGLATNGASVSEVMGNGAAATTNQKFSLKQTPLTFTQAATPTGRQSTLQVQANQVSWSEVPSLYGQPGNAAVFATLNQPGGNTDVLFGDGAEGATLPTGTNNIQANYRVGGGAAGNVAAGAITTLLDRPVGVNGVSNPLGATGGQDAQNVAGIRASAPQTVLTLGRAVSIADYQNFAASFAGIAKAAAIWIPSGPGRGVFITVAGVNGVAMPPGTPTLTNLVAALQGYGNPLMPIHVASFVETLFGLSANLTYDPAYQIPLVQAQVQQCLATSFGFASRKFGQGVSADQITAVIQAVPGVIAVNVAGVMTGASSYGGDLASEGASYSLSRYIQWQSQPATVIRPAAPGPNHICPYIPSPSTTGLPMAAEILVLDPRPGQVTLGTMP